MLPCLTANFRLLSSAYKLLTTFYYIKDLRFFLQFPYLDLQALLSLLSYFKAFNYTFMQAKLFSHMKWKWKQCCETWQHYPLRNAFVRWTLCNSRCKQMIKIIAKVEWKKKNIINVQKNNKKKFQLDGITQTDYMYICRIALSRFNHFFPICSTIDLRELFRYVGPPCS